MKEGIRDVDLNSNRNIELKYKRQMASGSVCLNIESSSSKDLPSAKNTTLQLTDNLMPTNVMLTQLEETSQNSSKSPSYPNARNTPPTP